MDGYDLRAWRRLCDMINLRDGWACQAACGCTAELSMHHIVPRAEGGSDDPANLITLCSMCHDEIENTNIRTVEEVRAYDAKWHATSSWWPTTVQRMPRKAKSTRKPKVRKVATPRPLKPAKTCEECGAQYHPETARSLYCCHRCRLIGNSKRQRDRAAFLNSLSYEDRTAHWQNRTAHFPYYVPYNEGAK